MKQVKSKLFGSLVCLSSLAMMSSCSEEFDPQVVTADDKFRQEYAENFFKHYGNFPENQSWDFSNAPRTAPTDPSIFDLGREQVFTRSTSSSGHTPEAETEVSLADAISSGVLKVPSGTPGTETDPYYYLEVETYDWLKANLPEGINNTPKGSPFVFQYNSPYSTDQKFAIIPFYQGFGSVVYKLHMVAVDQKKDYVIWDNWSDGLDSEGKFNPYSVTGTDAYQCNKTEYQPSHTSDKWVNVNKTDRLDNIDINKNIRSKPMIISGVQGQFYFYLEVTQNTSGYEAPGAHMSSKEGMMLALPCPAPAHINDYKKLFGVDPNDKSKTIDQVMVIGCEDTKKSDWDINDIVFMIVGLTDLPQKVEAKHSKRYLFEDLGTTVDFDFNDVVVDVTETVVINPDGTEGEVLAQEAVLRHKCGTVPFQVYFCDKDGDPIYSGAGVFDEMKGHVQGQAEQYTYFDDEGVRVRLVYINKGAEKDKDKVNYKQVGSPFWGNELGKDNIRIKVFDKRADGTHGNIKTAHFTYPSETGAPYIIAVPTTQMWTAEGADFPIGTFTELE